MRTIYKALVYSNIWVALAVVALCFISVEPLTTLPLSFLAFVFCATAFTYSYMRLVQINIYRGSGSSGTKDWAARYPAIVWVLTIVFGGLALWFFLKTDHPALLWLMILPGLISLLYPISFRNAFSNFTSLRAVPGLKMFLIALNWSYVSVLVPAALYSQLHTGVILEFVMRGILIIGLVIPFDIRDQTLDDEKMQTLPQILGIRPARQIAMFAVFLYQFWTVLRVIVFDYSLISALALVTGFELAYWLIRYASPLKRDSYFSFWLEAVPILAAGLLMLAHWLF